MAERDVSQGRSSDCDGHPSRNVRASIHRIVRDLPPALAVRGRDRALFLARLPR